MYSGVPGVFAWVLGTCGACGVCLGCCSVSSHLLDVVDGLLGLLDLVGAVDGSLLGGDELGLDGGDGGLDLLSVGVDLGEVEGLVLLLHLLDHARGRDLRLPGGPVDGLNCRGVERV